MRVEINHETCELSGKCTFFHPELFKEREDGYPVVTVAEIGPEQREALLDAIDSCPTGSIALHEDGGDGG
jgi:ferredoxin